MCEGRSTLLLAWLIAAFVTSSSPILDFYFNKYAVPLHAHPLTRLQPAESSSNRLSDVLAAFWKTQWTKRIWNDLSPLCYGSGLPSSLVQMSISKRNTFIDLLTHMTFCSNSWLQNNSKKGRDLEQLSWNNSVFFPT